MTDAVELAGRAIPLRLRAFRVPGRLRLGQSSRPPTGSAVGTRKIR